MLPLLAGAGTAALLGHAGLAALALTPAHRAVGVHRRLRDRGRVAITFDDGPQPGALERFLELLARENVLATFFLVGEQAARHPALVRELRDARHEIASHGWAHPNDLLLRPGRVVADIRRGAEALAGIVGRPPALHRAPYGVVSAATVLGTRRAHLALVLWSRWGRDWTAAATPTSIARRATRRLRGGDIILLHDADTYGTRDSWKNTLAALPYILEAVRERGLEPGPIGGRAALA